MKPNWRERSRLKFDCEKRSVTSADGIVVANHPLGAAAGAEMLAAGGNAVDAAVATLLTLTVVEPMMVGLIGGGMMHIRDPDGEHVVIDGQSQAPAAATENMFTPISDNVATRLETVGRRNTLGPLATATAGNLKAWNLALEKHGRFSLADVLAPAIRHAERGFAVSSYLHECVCEAAADLATDSAIAALYLPNSTPIAPGLRLRQPAYAETLKALADEGAPALYGGSIGAEVARYMSAKGGILTANDFRDYTALERAPVRGQYRGVEIVGPPPPSAGGVHVLQMLNLLSGFDIAEMGYGSADSIHLLAEVMKLAFADRDAATGDPAFLDVPEQQLVSAAYATTRRPQIDLQRARNWSSEVLQYRDSQHTTHMTVIDRDGGIVSATHTINSLFGARYLVGDTGMVGNNYMHLFDPHPNRALSIAPGKRVPTSMSPLIGVVDGIAQFALGVVGGVRIFPSAMQAVVNLLDHHMTLQEAIEAPRIWTQGGKLELETATFDMASQLSARGHEPLLSKHLGGGMNAIRRVGDQLWEGAACWRADGHAIALGGGPARQGVRFKPD
jgi:gamma-glutamyltranspeptidase / glutathione hydrolase